MRLLALAVGAVLAWPTLTHTIGSELITPGSKMLAVSALFLIYAILLEASIIERYSLMADVAIGACVFVLALSGSTTALAVESLVVFAVIRALFGGPSPRFLVSLIAVPGGYAAALMMTANVRVPTGNPAAEVVLVVLVAVLVRAAEQYLSRRYANDSASHVIGQTEPVAMVQPNLVSVRVSADPASLLSN